MSFGVSIGDLLVVGKFISGTIFIFSGSTIVQYEDLVWELREFEELLTEIRDLQCGPGQEVAFCKLKQAAQRRRNHVDLVTRQVDKFKALGTKEKASRFKRLVARLRWGLTMTNEASKTRNDLMLYKIDLRQQMVFLMNLHMASMSIDLQHTWFQAPVIVLDALGDILRVPPEYCWNVRYVSRLNSWYSSTDMRPDAARDDIEKVQRRSRCFQGSR